MKLKKFAHESLLSGENNSCASSRKVIEVKDNWVNIRATMDTGVAVHVTSAEMFPRVKLDRTNTTEKFVAADGEGIKDLGEKTIPFKSLKERKCCEAFDLNEKGRASWQCRRAQQSVHHGRVGVSRRNWSSFQLARTASGPSVTNKPVRPRTMCSSESEESYAGQELNGLEEGEGGDDIRRKEKGKQKQQTGD